MVAMTLTLVLAIATLICGTDKGGGNGDDR